MTPVTYQQVLDAIKSVELHHFQGTSIVICCLSTTDGDAILGVSNAPTGGQFVIEQVAAQARHNAEKELAQRIEHKALAAEQEKPPESGASS